MSELKITYCDSISKNDIDHYLGKPTILHYKLNQHECEVSFKIGWSMDDFRSAIMDGFWILYLECGEMPESIHIQKLEEDKSILN